ncbi:hypothetical protein IRJ41_011394 [Triplophysa rosa]|uniref:Uncharacterized protein n=1 Tax=Triplophysa rosa TaxID=992332 RepID=A0A9W7TWV4_TRIRA|nr:hypothetical protein IRJ41_011394 [Triplophysa rosa]
MKKVCDTLKHWGRLRLRDVRLFLTYYEFFMVFVVLTSTATEVALTFESVVVTSGQVRVEEGDGTEDRKKALTIRYVQLLKQIDEKHHRLKEMAKIQHRFFELMCSESVYPYEDDYGHMLPCCVSVEYLGFSSSLVICRVCSTLMELPYT